MSLVANDVCLDVPALRVADMPALHIWVRRDSIDVHDGDSADLIRQKMTTALNALLERPVHDAVGNEISPQIGRKPS